MYDEDALLQALLLDPRDDTVRYAYADCLCERGGDGDGARAEFINLSLRLEQFDGTDPGRETVVSRARDLFLTHASTGEWPEYGWVFDWARAASWRSQQVRPVQVDGVFSGALGCPVRVRRGFPYWLLCGASEFARDAGHWFQQFPITTVTLADRFVQPFSWDYQFDRSGDHYYYLSPNEGRWLRGFRQDDQLSIPDCIYDLLAGGQEPEHGVRIYESGAAEAQEDLHLACLRYGRREAGLPYYPTHCHRYA